MEEEVAACEIAPLPGELLVEVLSLAGPRDAAAVCRDFRTAAESDAVWSRLPAPRPPASRRGRALPGATAAVHERALPTPLRRTPSPPTRTHEHVVGQGERRQVLYALGQGAANYLGRYAAVMALDPSRRFKVQRRC